MADRMQQFPDPQETLILGCTLSGYDPRYPNNILEIDVLVQHVLFRGWRICFLTEALEKSSMVIPLEDSPKWLRTLENLILSWLTFRFCQSAKEGKTVSLIDGNWADFERSISSLSPILKECRFAARVAGWSILAAEECTGSKLNCVGCPFAGPDNPPEEIIND
jgi:hypothetical protein